MSDPSTPSKRPLDQTNADSNGKGKLQRLAGDYSSNQSVKSSHSGIIFRVLCPLSKLDTVVGKDGSVTSQICEETGVKIIVEETVSGCSETVLQIKDCEEEAEANVGEHKENGGDDANETEGGESVKEDVVKEKVSGAVNNSKGVRKTSDMQKALFFVFERLVEAELKKNAGDEESNKSSAFVLRLIVPSSQVGCVLGKGGSVIKLMAAESGAQIRVLPRDKLPRCASAADEVVQITGEINSVKKALQSVSRQLLENPPLDHESFSVNSGGPSHPLASSQGASYAAPRRDTADFHSGHQRFHEGGMPGRLLPSRDMLTYRMLCYDERVGGVIGKGGAIIKALMQETGCEIKVLEPIPDSDDRLIIISGPAHPDDRISPPQDAVLRVYTRIYRALPESRDPNVMARFLVSSNQIGCLLGKGGSIIAEMRKSTRAYIRIMGKEQIPKCASEDEEVVQIGGEFEAVQEALVQITTRLRHHFFRDAFPSINHHLNPFMDQGPPFPSFMGRRELSPPGLYPNFGPFSKFDAAGGPPARGGFHFPDDRSLLMHHLHRPGMAPHMSERKPWVLQGSIIDGGGPLGLPDFAGPPHRRITGFGGGSQPAIITSTTVEVVVPRSVVPVINGEDGACLKQIRQISDARVTITEPNPGATETVIIISGTPEQTHAAQSLIQAFVLSETQSS